MPDVSTNPLDYVQGINPYVPNPLQKMQQTDLTQNILDSFGQATPDAGYVPDARYERALAMLEELTTNPASKRAKETEDKYYGKGLRRIGLGLLEGISGGYRGKEYKNPYDRALQREQEVDKEKLSALHELIPNLRNTEVANIRSEAQKAVAAEKAKGVEQQNMIKLKEQLRKEGRDPAEIELILRKAALVGSQTVMQELQNTYTKETGSLMSKTPDEAKLWGLFAGVDPSKMTPDQARKAAYEKAMLAPGVLGKAFGGQQRTSVSPTRKGVDKFGPSGNYLRTDWVEGPSKVSTSISGGNPELSKEIRRMFSGESGAQSPQPPRPPAPAESGTAPNMYPAPLPQRAVPVPSPLGGNYAQPRGEREFSSAASARMARETELQENQKAETARLGRSSVVRLLNSGHLDKYSGLIGGSQTGQAVLSLIGRNIPENTNMRTFLGRQYWNELFDYTGKQTNEREQKLAKEITPDPGTQNSKTLLQNSLRSSVYADAYLWRSRLQGEQSRLAADFPLQKAVDVATKLYEDILAAKKRGAPLSEDVINKRMNPETIYASELRKARGTKTPWSR